MTTSLTIQFPSKILAARPIEDLKRDAQVLLGCTKRIDEVYLRSSAQLFLDILESIAEKEGPCVGCKRSAPVTRHEMLEFPRELLGNRCPNELVRHAYLLIDWVFEENLEHACDTSEINFTLMRYIRACCGDVANKRLAA